MLLSGGSFNGNNNSATQPACAEVYALPSIVLVWIESVDVNAKRRVPRYWPISPNL